MTNLIIFGITLILLGYSILDVIITEQTTEWILKIGGSIIAFLGLYRLYRKDQHDRDTRRAKQLEQNALEHQEMALKIEQIMTARQACQNLQNDNYKKSLRGIANLTGEVKRNNEKMIGQLEGIHKDMHTQIKDVLTQVNAQITSVSIRVDDLYKQQTSES